MSYMPPIHVELVRVHRWLHVLRVYMASFVAVYATVTVSYEEPEPRFEPDLCDGDQVFNMCWQLHAFRNAPTFQWGEDASRPGTVHDDETELPFVDPVPNHGDVAIEKTGVAIEPANLAHIDWVIEQVDSLPSLVTSLEKWHNTEHKVGHQEHKVNSFTVASSCRRGRDSSHPSTYPPRLVNSGPSSKRRFKMHEELVRVG